MSMVKQSSSMSSSSSSKTSSSSSSKMSSTSTKKTTSSSKTMSSSSYTSYMTSSSKRIGFNSSSNSFADTFGKSLGIDMGSDLLKITSGQSMDDKMAKMRREMLHLMPLEMASPGANTLVKLDSNSISDYLDKDNDLLRFNFDVNEFSSETVDIKCDGNKIEVHAKKTKKVGDEESSEEYSRTYEMPTTNAIEPGNIKSSFYKDGVLTVELPCQGMV